MTLGRMNFDLREPCCSLLMLGLIMAHRMPLSGPQDSVALSGGWASAEKPGPAQTSGGAATGPRTGRDSESLTVLGVCQ